MSDASGGDLPPPPPGGGGGFWNSQPAGTPPPFVPSGPSEAENAAPADERPEHLLEARMATGFGQSYVPVAPNTETNYAGFWRRAWARVVTGVLWIAVVGAGNTAIQYLTIWLSAEQDSCRRVGRATNDVCELTEWILWIGFGASWLFGVVASYLIWSRRVARHGATAGMSAMGLTVHNVSDHNHALSDGQAFKRSFIALLPFWFASGFGFVVLFNPQRRVVTLFALIELGLVALTLLGALLMLVTARRQTLWDLAADTVVIEEREPSWLAVAAFVFGILVPATIGIGVASIGASNLNERYDEAAANGAGSVVLLALPLAVVCVAAIVLGHLAIGRTDWSTKRAGRGLARTGVLFGYSVPLLTVAALAFSFLYDEVNERNERTCNELRTEAIQAAASYLAFNGTYPTDVAAIGEQIYVDDPELGAKLEIAGDPGTEDGYRFIGECNK